MKMLHLVGLQVLLMRRLVSNKSFWIKLTVNDSLLCFRFSAPPVLSI